MKENDIRPADLFNEYLRLAERDAERFFADQRRFREVPCPGCGHDSPEAPFSKLGFRYVTCAECASLYASPRPTREQIVRYYREGEAVRFWATDFFKATSEARRERIFAPRARLVAEQVRRRDSLDPKIFADIGSGYGILLEEMERLDLFDELWAIEPSPPLAEVCRKRGFSVLEKSAEGLETGEIHANFATAFEVLEHLYDPLDFLRSVRRALAPGGLFLFTTLTVTGFDIQVLWERSKSVHPPHHLNLISTDGMGRLVKRAGFVLDDLSTPGKLDIDILRNALREDPTIEIPRFVHRILDAPARVQRDFQAFLQRSGLSSHVQVIAGRPSG